MSRCSARSHMNTNTPQHLQLGQQTEGPWGSCWAQGIPTGTLEAPVASVWSRPCPGP